MRKPVSNAERQAAYRERQRDRMEELEGELRQQREVVQEMQLAARRLEQRVQELEQRVQELETNNTSLTDYMLLFRMVTQNAVDGFETKSFTQLMRHFWGYNAEEADAHFDAMAAYMGLPRETFEQALRDGGLEP